MLHLWSRLDILKGLNLQLQLKSGRKMDKNCLKNLAFFLRIYEILYFLRHFRGGIYARGGDHRLHHSRLLPPAGIVFL